MTSQSTSTNRSSSDNADRITRPRCAQPPTTNQPGYEDLVWHDVKEQGFQMPEDDGVEADSWLWKQKNGWRVWDRDGDEFWLCKICHASRSSEQHWFKTSRSTMRAKRHLNVVHHIGAKGATSQSPGRKKKRKLDESEDGYETATASAGISVGPVNPFDLRKSFLQCVIAGHIALGGLDSAPLRRLVECSNPQARLPSLGTVSGWITKAYDRQLGVIASMLASATTKVSLSFNLSTRDGSHRLLGVGAHFIVRDGKRQSVLVSLPRRRNGRNTCNITEVASAIIAEHNLEKSLGYFVTDNPSRDSARIPVSTFDQSAAAKDRWTSCSGEILTQIARTVLFGSDADSLDRELVVTQDDELQRMDVWRRRGPCGKLRNIVAYFGKYHPQWEECLEHDQRHVIAPAMPGTKVDVFKHVEHDTGWEVMGDLIARALYLRPALEELKGKEMLDHHAPCRDRPDGSLPPIANDRLTPHDWQVLEAYHDILQRIKEVKGVLQGRAGCRFGAIWQVLPQFDALLAHLDEIRQRHFAHDERQATSPRPQTPQPKERASRGTAVQECVREVCDDATARLQNAESHEISRTALQHRFDAEIARTAVEYQTNANVGTAWQRVHDYCDVLHGNVLYVAAVVLHPRIRWRYLEAKWKGRKDRLSTYVSALNRHWRDNYRDSAAGSRTLGEETVRGNERAQDEWSDGEAWDLDQFEEYQSEQPDRSYESTDSPVEYWVKRRKMWPQLSAMALDIYSVPVTAYGPELTSSRATRSWPAEEQTLDDDTRACLMCLRIWQSSGIVEIDDDLFEGTSVMPDG